MRGSGWGCVYADEAAQTDLETHFATCIFIRSGHQKKQMEQQKSLFFPIDLDHPSNIIIIITLKWTYHALLQVFMQPLYSSLVSAAWGDHSTTSLRFTAHLFLSTAVRKTHINVAGDGQIYSTAPCPTSEIGGGKRDELTFSSHYI